MGKIKFYFKKILMGILYPHRINSERFIKYLNRHGCEIGEGTYFFDPINTQIDISRISLLKIGKYCKITSGVHILTHDYSRSVLRLKYGEIINSAKVTDIGDNVFIGLRTIILPGVKIGNNVIIAAGSVVVKNVPGDCVIGGNPAKVLSSLDDFYVKRKKLFVDEAVSYGRRIKETKKRNPKIHEMGDFFPLYFSGSIKELQELGYNPRCNGDNRDGYLQQLELNKPLYSEFEIFLKSL